MAAMLARRRDAAAPNPPPDRAAHEARNRVAARRRRPALPDGRPLGAHLPLGSGMVKAVERAHEIGADAIQVFADNPTAWRRRVEPPPELPAFRRRLAELGIGPIAIHAAYLINLAGSDVDLYERSLALLASEMSVAPGYGARFVNVHVGSHRGAGTEAGIARVADGIAQVLAQASAGPGAPVLVLENSAGSGDGLGVSVEELALILEAAEARGVDRDRLAICLDTAHLWGAGIDIGTIEGVDMLVDAVAARIGLERLVMIHLSDSKAPLGSAQDRHQHIAAGEIGPAGLARLLTHPLLGHVAYFLETPGMDEGFDAVNVRRARQLAAGRHLARLPKAALELRGSRGRTPPAAV
jgi:deoxyribonuclease-4